jgi:hypothetical protein
VKTRPGGTMNAAPPFMELKSSITFAASDVVANADSNAILVVSSAMITVDERPAGQDLAIPSDFIERHIFLIRGHKVMTDSDLAMLYDVPTGALNRAVKRNLDRFPADFCFQLTPEGVDLLRCQNGISNSPGRGGRRYQPYVFTEQGVAMLASVLSGPRAVQVSIGVVRVFVKIRVLIAANSELSRRLDELEHRVGRCDADIQNVFDALRDLMAPEPVPAKHQIGFHAPDRA